MSKVILFDIDGTLILSGGAGMRALNRACEEITGFCDALAEVPLAGRTDRIILYDAMRKAGRELDEDLLSALRTPIRSTPAGGNSISRPRRESDPARRA